MCDTIYATRSHNDEVNPPASMIIKDLSKEIFYI